MKIKRVIGTILFALITVISIFGWEEVKLSFFRQEGSFYNLSFEKLGDVEYYSLMADRVEYDNNGEKTKREYISSREENYRKEIIDLLYNLEIREVSFSEYRKNTGTIPIYEIIFSGRSEENESERISYIYTNIINIKLHRDIDYIEVYLNNGKDFREIKRYKIVSGDLDFDILDSFIGENTVD